MQPKYETLSISKLAKALGIDRRTVAKRLEGLGAEATIEDLIGALLTSNGIEEARRRKAVAEAESKELKVAQERGELLKRTDAINAVVEILKWLSNETAVLLPRRLSQQLVGKEEREIQAILTREIGAVHDVARDKLIRTGSISERVSAPKPHRVPVGRRKPRAVG